MYLNSAQAALQEEGVNSVAMIRIFIRSIVFTQIVAGCATAPRAHHVTLKCPNTWESGGFIGHYSLAKGPLNPPVNPDEVDVVYYFDEDDCAHGAVMGRDDKEGFLFPLGHKSWNELLTLHPPTQDAKSVAAIAPVTEAEEGLAFWLKIGNGNFALVRVKSVRAASYDDVVAGAAPFVELEWIENPGEQDRARN